MITFIFNGDFLKRGDNLLNYYEVYKDVWLFHKKYMECLKDTDDFWDECVTELRSINHKYNDSRFVGNLLLNELNEFKRLLRG